MEHIRKRRSDLQKYFWKIKLLSEKELELKDLENSQPIHLQKLRKYVQKITLRVWLINNLIRRLVWV